MPFTIAVSYSFCKIADFYYDERFIVNYIFRVSCDKIDEVPWNLNFSTSITFYKTIDCGYLCNLIILSYPIKSCNKETERIRFVLQILSRKAYFDCLSYIFAHYTHFVYFCTFELFTNTYNLKIVLLWLTSTDRYVQQVPNYLKAKLIKSKNYQSPIDR